MRPGVRTPVLPQQARIVLERQVTREETGCLRSSRTPSKERPSIEIPGGRQTMAARVVAAVTIGRPIEADEDVHHTCENKRCVEPTHLVVELHLDHSSQHAEAQRQTHCSVHGTPYDRVDARGWGVCWACRRSATYTYRERQRELMTL